MSAAQNDLPLPMQDQPKPHTDSGDPSIELIRSKVSKLYETEPAAQAEEQEISTSGPHSKHQHYIGQLMGSGKSLAEVQTAWHLYYQGLNDDDKRLVWREFYENSSDKSQYYTNTRHKADTKSPKVEHDPHPTKQIIGNFEQPTAQPQNTTQNLSELKKRVLKKVGSGKLKKNHHLKSLLFGVSMGLLAVFIIMFGFFNERIIAPFIAPSRAITNTPIIIDATADNAVAPDPIIIIPKINVEVPVIYDVASIDEKQIESGLDRGVVHYPTTPSPGQTGNVVIFGHSANNIFNRGKYKYVFSLLNRLQEGDTFMLNYYGQRYVYKVYSKKIVNPNQVSVIGTQDRTSTATLITCDPPGTSTHRLVVVGEQVSPAPAKNVAATQLAASGTPTTIPSAPESLFHRLFGWIWD